MVTTTLSLGEGLLANVVGAYSPTDPRLARVWTMAISNDVPRGRRPSCFTNVPAVLLAVAHYGNHQSRIHFSPNGATYGLSVRCRRYTRGLQRSFCTGSLYCRLAAKIGAAMAGGAIVANLLGAHELGCVERCPAASLGPVSLGKDNTRARRQGADTEPTPPPPSGTQHGGYAGT